MYQIEQIHTSWSEANAKLEQLKEEQLALSTVVSAHDAKLESDRSALRQLEQEVEDLQSQLLQFSELFEKSEGYGEVLRNAAATWNVRANSWKKACTRAIIVWKSV